MTEYVLATTPNDFAAAQELIDAEGTDDATIGHPTLMAIKDGELTAVLGTHITDNNFIVAGPLVIKSGAHRFWTLIRLIDEYDRVMRGIGITQYLFSVEDSNSDWLDKIEKTFAIEPYAHERGRFFYIRNL